MNSIQITFSLLGRFWGHIGSRRRVQFFLLLFLMIVSSFAEVASIGAILPFLGLISNPADIAENARFKPYFQMFGLQSNQSILILVTILFCIMAICAAILRLILLWGNTKFSHALGADLSNGMYRRILYQPYSMHLSQNSSEVLNGIIGKANFIIYSLVGPTMQGLSATIIMVVVLGALFSVDAMTTLVIMIIFGSIYGISAAATQSLKIANSRILAKLTSKVIQALQEGLGGIRDILIGGNQEIYCRIYEETDRPLRQAQASNQFASHAPRFVAEAIGMVLIAIVACELAQSTSTKHDVFPIMGFMALAGQRLLPAIQQIYVSWSSLQNNRASLIDTLQILDKPLSIREERISQVGLPFSKKIELKNIYYKYSDGEKWLFKDLNFTVEKGEIVGLIGVTGVGKSTLIDVLVGLLDPAKGKLCVDGVEISSANLRSWQAKIAYVPQSIFLSDASIEENVAFGVAIDKIDSCKVKLSVERARLSEAIEGFEKKYKTLVGERGVRLSGGQRQRIGLARAFYKDAEIIILDEATSALDGKTEYHVVESIRNSSEHLTVIIVAHRISTLKYCNAIYELGKEGIINKRMYSQLIAEDSNQKYDSKDL